MINSLFTLRAGLAALLLGTAAFADTVRIADQKHTRYEWRASTYSLSAQAEAAIAVDPAGRTVAVWSSRRQQGGKYGVYAQRFDANGVALGSETEVNVWTRSHQLAPALGIGQRGDTWIAWQSHGQDGQAGAIIARHFDAEFTGGSEILVNSQWRGEQNGPVIAVAPNGSAMIVWTSASSLRARPVLKARIFDAHGKPLCDEFAVTTGSGRRESVPAVAAAPDGTFAVAFGVTDERAIPAGIRLCRFGPAGKRLGHEAVVSGRPKKNQIEPAIAATHAGFVIAWLDTESDGDDYGVVARRLGADGRPLGEPFVVNSNWRGPQNAAAIAVSRDGRFAIAWNSADADETGVFARLFRSDGAPLGEQFRLSKHTEKKQAMRQASGTTRLAFGPSDGLLCVWNGDGGFGDSSSVNVTLLAPAPLELAGRTQGVTAKMTPATPLLARAGGPQPHEPPFFDPTQIASDAEREIVFGPDGIGFDGVLNTGWTPPDPHIAVGPTHIVLMTNGAIAFFDKAGTRTFQDEIEGLFGFWGSLGTTSFVFDPEVLYDELSGRFFAMASEARASGRSFILLAVSDDSDPNGTWHKYRLESTSLAGDLLDSPNIGVDDQAVYVTGDGFGAGSNYPIFIFDKASLLAGDPPAITRSLTLPTSTQSAGIPPVSYDSPPGLYMIEHQEGAANTQVRLIVLRDPLGSPTTSTIQLTVPSYGPPEDPPQQGTSVRPETFDARFWNVAYRNGSLWATHHVNSGRVVARWYEIAMNGWPVSGSSPALVQSGEIDPGPGVRTFFCSITVADNGNAAICFARGAFDEFLSMGTAYRLASDPLGTFRPSTIEKVSTGPYTFARRWGDYSGVQVDPADGLTFWANHEYAQGNSWITWVAGFVTAAPFFKGDMNCDGAINGADIDPFFLALGDPAAYALQFPNCDVLNGDMNGDGALNGGDIDLFFDCLGNGNCP